MVVEPDVVSVVVDELPDVLAPRAPLVEVDVEPDEESEAVAVSSVVVVVVMLLESLALVADEEDVAPDVVVADSVAAGAAVAAAEAVAAGVAVAAAVLAAAVEDVVFVVPDVEVHPAISSIALNAAAIFISFLSIYVLSFMHLQDTQEI